MAGKITIIEETEDKIIEYQMDNVYEKIFEQARPVHDADRMNLNLDINLGKNTDGIFFTVKRTEKHPLKIKKYRKTIEYQAVKITKKNLEKVAEWCGGKAIMADINSGLMAHVDLGYVRVETIHRRAFIGQYIRRIEREGASPIYAVLTEDELDELVDDES